jgi:hypothetical protein
MNIIGNFLLSDTLAHHLQMRLNNLPNTAIQARDVLPNNPTLRRVVVKTDMPGWQQFGQIITEYGIA